ncbi:MAG: hypothetical protein HY905_28075 [Deltaproteobacteria bacterium]|nr:hypothetical protein [Deltaproteobacteria bacterium]
MRRTTTLPHRCSSVFIGGFLLLWAGLAACKSRAVGAGGATEAGHATVPAEAGADAATEGGATGAVPGVDGGAPAPAESPEEVVRRYIRLGAAGGDLAGARELVDPRCWDTSVGRVEAVILLGVRMAVGKIETTVLESGETAARIEARVSGSVYATDTATSTEVLGTKVNIQVGELNVGGMVQTTTLRLKKIDGVWRVSCREAG